MLQNIRIVSFVLLTSQLLVIVQQCAGSDEVAVCKNNKGTINIQNDEGTCKCTINLPSNDGYSYVEGGSAYKFHAERMTWDKARKTCEAEGSRLAILESDLERRVLLDLMELYLVQLQPASDKSRLETHVWLGIHDQFQEGEWINLLDEPLSYAPWANASADCASTKQPNGGTVSNCGCLVRNCGHMDDLSCKWRLPFFCEKPHTCFE